MVIGPDQDVRLTPIYKIVPASLWRQAIAAGVFTGAPIDVADGYIHFSTAAQTLETAAKHFHGQHDLLLVMAFAEDFGPDLRWEPSRGGALFPHLYAPFPLHKARQVHPITRLEDGSHNFAGLL